VKGSTGTTKNALLPESYLTLAAEDQRDILNASAAVFSRRAQVLEKDVWVCWALDILFSIDDLPLMAFRGGTSLSKVYGTIDRFSEDIDVTLDYRNWGDSVDPFAAGVSRSQIKKLSKRLTAHVETFARDAVVPAISKALGDIPGSENTQVHFESPEKVWISYPSVVETDDYLHSRVLIELGGRNVIDPCEDNTLTPDIASQTDGVSYPTPTVKVVSPQRTFWEKATLAHVECLRGNLNNLKSEPNRLSRHWYDLMKLADSDIGTMSLADRTLLEEVVAHKKVFFHAGYADYDACLDGRMRLVPDADDIDGLRTDYERMCQAGMIYGTPPAFAELHEVLNLLEANINDSGGGPALLS